jgi:[protein-PII] uridylyltransferase
VRPASKERFAALLAAAREEYAGSIRLGEGGRAALQRYAARIDDLIREIAGSAAVQPTSPFALCALGGYGRRALCLHSDIDLLIVFDGPIGHAEEQLVKALLHPLWDLRLTVGHQVCELADLGRPDADNPEFMLALLDARHVAGEQDVSARAYRAGTAGARTLLESLLALVDRRHAAFNDTFYQLEPDVKEAPGGLRDVAAARWLRVLAGDAWNDNSRIDDRRLAESEEFLLRIRSTLHLETGRNGNVLSHALQERVADVLRYPGASPQQQVEGLMSDYFRHARAAARALEWSRRAARGPRRHVEPLALGSNLELTADGIRFADCARAALEPGSWVLAFRTALDHGCAVSDQALTCIEQHVDRYAAGEFVSEEPHRQLMRGLLRPRRGLYARLSEMHECGLLERIFPEFEKVHCRVVRDFYHKYTVDEHTLLTIRNLESLLDPPNASRDRFANLLRELQAPDLLTLSLLFHDVGKWKDEDHDVESVRMAQSMLARLRLPRDARLTVEFLIGSHLEMSRAAFRRDAEDPDVVRRFAALVGTEERLKMLCLMTLADVEAVSPDTLTPWKEELLWRLYVDTYNRLTLAYADDLIEKDHGPAALRDSRPDDIAESELADFLAGLPKRYLAIFDPERIYRHVRLARDIHPDQVHAFLEKKDDVWELTVVTLDKPYLFSNISGVLSYFGMDILRGQAMTAPSGLVLDVFQFTDAQGFLRHNPGATAEIYEVLQGVVAGARDVTQMLRGKERGAIGRRRLVAPTIYFDDGHSQRYSVLEIIAGDAPGLLYRISRVLSEHGCDLDLVLIATEGEKAIDVLHVTKHGSKLTEGDQAALKEALERTLQTGSESD